MAKSKKAQNLKLLAMSEKVNLEGVIEAINAAANVDAKDDEGFTALMWAVKNGRAEIVNALIKAGAYVNINGGTALIFAVMGGYQ